MRYATLGQMNDRLYAIDDLLFKLATGQASASAEEQQKLVQEADWIMDALAKGVSEEGQYDYQTVFAEREKVRRAKRFAAIAARYLELYPDPDPVADAIVVKACADGATEEDFAALDRMYSVIFVNPAPPPIPPPPAKGVFGRLFSRRR